MESKFKTYSSFILNLLQHHQSTNSGALDSNQIQAILSTRAYFQDQADKVPAPVVIYFPKNIEQYQTAILLPYALGSIKVLIISLCDELSDKIDSAKYHKKLLRKIVNNGQICGEVKNMTDPPVVLSFNDHAVPPTSAEGVNFLVLKLSNVFSDVGNCLNKWWKDYDTIIVAGVYRPYLKTLRNHLNEQFYKIYRSCSGVQKMLIFLTDDSVDDVDNFTFPVCKIYPDGQSVTPENPNISSESCFDLSNLFEELDTPEDLKGQKNTPTKDTSVQVDINNYTSICCIDDTQIPPDLKNSEQSERLKVNLKSNGHHEDLKTFSIANTEQLRIQHEIPNCFDEPNNAPGICRVEACYNANLLDINATNFLCSNRFSEYSLNDHPQNSPSVPTGDIWVTSSSVPKNNIKEEYSSIEVNHQVIEEDIPSNSTGHFDQTDPGTLVPKHDTVEFGKEKITYDSTKLLGTGASGTSVFEGKFGSRTVAVKCIWHFKNDYRKEAIQEIASLSSCDGHTNIVRYISAFEYEDKILLALEICSATLEEWITDNSCIPNGTNIAPVHILEQVTEGLTHLHANNIIHRDLKPSNILFQVNGSNVTVKLADFGISKRINDGQTSATFTSPGGSEGWMAPETLRFIDQMTSKRKKNDQQNYLKIKMKPETDIFSLGLIFYYIITNGEHPFGENTFSRNYKILQGEHVISSDSHDNLDVRINSNLLIKMLASLPEERPKAKEVLKNEIFWTSRKRLNFLVNISNFVEGLSKSKCDNENQHLDSSASKIQCIKALEETYFPKISGDGKNSWFSQISSELVLTYLNTNSHTRSRGKSVIGLLRVIRNMNNHYYNTNDCLDAEVKSEIGEIPGGFVTFWESKFPLLVYNVKQAFISLSNDSCLQEYY